jgi:hypothetical protein
MPALTTYTSYDEVRAVIGVTSDELTDATLALTLYSTMLSFELGSIGDTDNDGTLATAFDTIDAILPASRTASEQRLHDAVTLFAPFAVVLHLETAAPLFAPKAITDGKAGVTRHAESPFKEQFARARQMYERFRQNLERAWASYSSLTATITSLPTRFAVSSPDTDPVVDDFV